MGKVLGILFGLGIGLKLGILPALFLCYIGHKIGKSFDDAFQNFAKARIIRANSAAFMTFEISISTSVKLIFQSYLFLGFWVILQNLTAWSQKKNYVCRRCATTASG